MQVWKIEVPHRGDDTRQWQVLELSGPFDKPKADLIADGHRNPPSAPLIERNSAPATTAKEGEPQLRVDDWSTLPPESTYFLQANRGKRSVTVNLKNKDGLRVVHELVKQADVLVRSGNCG